MSPAVMVLRGNDGETPCACAEMRCCHLRKKPVMGRPENEPHWQPKIFYPTTHMEASPPIKERRLIAKWDGAHFP